MNTKMEQFMVYPRVKKAKTGKFFDLLKKSATKIKRGGKKTTLSRNVDKIVYGFAR
ncbi:MAG: hypothetical protein AAB837_02445 [Patescibacteria group bacterium]